MKLEVLFLCYSKADPTSFYRAGGVAQSLQRLSGYNITTIQWSDIKIDWQFLSHFDVVMLQRPHTKESHDLCCFIKTLNKKLWIDFDDDLFHLNPENKTFLLYEDPKIKTNIVNILKMADVVSVTNEYLRQVYRGQNKNIWVIPNAFNDELIKRTELTKPEKKIIWRGGDSHIYDLMKHATAINQCTEEHPDVEFIFWGYYPWFLSKTKNKAFLPAMDVIVFFEKLFKLHPAAIHVPLNDDTFNRCRSNTAYIEAAYCGAVCVCPNWWNLPGSLPYGNIQQYYENMKAILRGDIDIESMNRESWDVVNECFLLSKVNQKRVKLIESL